jgi:hypothetical protein
LRDPDIIVKLQGVACCAITSVLAVVLRLQSRVGMVRRQRLRTQKLGGILRGKHRATSSSEAEVRWVDEGEVGEQYGGAR